MKALLPLLAMILLVSGCQGTAKARFEGNALIVTHMPNPSNKHTSEYFPKPFYPYTWYYRTEVKNNSDRELKVIWFEGYVDNNEHWYGSNVLNRTLRNDVFMRWYGDEKGSNAKTEWMKPGEMRVCDPNWHGGYDPNGFRMKWSFIAIDKFSNDYLGEAIIESEPIKSDSNENARQGR